MICNFCKQNKDTSEFYSYKKSGKEYRKTTCKVCITAIKRNRYKDDLEYRNKLKSLSLDYAHSDIGKERRKISQLKRNKTLKFQEYKKKWALTEKGKSARRNRVNRFAKTEKGFAANKRRHARRRANTKNMIADLTTNEWQEILKEFNNKCAYCGITFSNEITPTQDHKTPISKGSHHTRDNIVPACRPCNSKKKDKIWQS